MIDEADIQDSAVDWLTRNNHTLQPGETVEHAVDRLYFGGWESFHADMTTGTKS